MATAVLPRMMFASFLLGVALAAAGFALPAVGTPARSAAGGWGKSPGPPVAVTVPGSTGPSLADLADPGFTRRPDGALEGTEFARRVAALDDHGRYAAARDEILAGNVPDFLRTLAAVEIDGAGHRVTLFVTRDYLSVGDDSDYLPVPLDFVDAAAIAQALGAGLPTPRIVDAIYSAAGERLDPVTLPPVEEMRTIEYALLHRARVDAERTAARPGALVAGTKKDVVLTDLLWTRPGHEAIYGWHRADGVPIQPLCLWHGATYADYSHGIRLVAGTALVDGQPRAYFDVLADPELAPLVSDEGPIPDAAALLEAATSGS